MWALSVLFSSRTATNREAAFGYPVLGIFVHFLLLLVVVGVGSLAEGFDVGVVAGAEGDRRWAIAMRSIVSVATMLSLWMAWIVRRGIWLHHEVLVTGTETPAVQAKEMQ